MIASKVTPPAAVEGVEMDGVEGVGEATILDCLERNYILLHLTIAASMAQIT